MELKEVLAALHAKAAVEHARMAENHRCAADYNQKFGYYAMALYHKGCAFVAEQCIKHHLAEVERYAKEGS